MWSHCFPVQGKHLYTKVNKRFVILELEQIKIAQDNLRQQHDHPDQDGGWGRRWTCNGDIFHDLVSFVQF